MASHVSQTASRPWPLWLRILLWVLGVVLLLALILAGVLAWLAYSPKAQTWATRRFLGYAVERTGFVGRCGYLYLDYRTRTVTVRDLHVTDLQQRPMIRLPEAVIHFSWDSVLRRDVSFDSLHAHNGWVNVVTNEKLKATNFSQFVDTIQRWVDGPPTHSPKDTLKRSDPPTFRINRLVLRDMEAIISNESRDTIPTGVDYNHLDWVDVNGSVAGFRARSDTLEFQTCNLRMRDRRSGWPIHRMCTYFRFSRHNMILDRLLVLAGHSEIHNRLEFHFSHPKFLSEFNDSVTVKAHLRNTRLDTRDLGMFAPPLRKYRDVLHIDNFRLHGRVVDYRADDIHIRFGRGSLLKGGVGMAGLPKGKPLYMDLLLTGSHLIPKDVKQYIPDSAAYAYVERMGVNDVDGFFRGVPDKFLIKANTKGDAGQVHVDLAMHITDKQSSTYKGRFEADKFKLGKFADTRLVGDFTGRGYVEGTGLVLTKAHIQLKSRIDEIRVLGIRVRHVALRGTLANHKIANLIGSIRVWKSGPFYKPGKMNDGSKFGLVWDKSKA